MSCSTEQLITSTIYLYTQRFIEMDDLNSAEECKQTNSSDWDSVFPFPAISPQVSALITFLVGTAVFANSAFGSFVFDDSEAVVNNQDVNINSPLSNVFFNDFWGTPLTHDKSHKSYRPITIITFRWNFWLAGGMHPFGFHLSNTFVHGFVSTLVIPVANNIFGGHAPRMSFLTSLLFAVHPVHTEAVAGVVGRADLLCALFCCLSFLTYVKATKATVTCKSIIYLASCIFLCSLALFSKEQGITILGVCLAYDLIVFQNVNIYHLPILVIQKFVCCSHKRDSKSLVDRPYKKPVFKMDFILRFLSLALSGVLLLYARWRIMGSKPPEFQRVDNPASFSEDLLTRVWTYNYLYSLNAWLLLCPEWLCFDWSMGCIQLLSALSDLRLLVVLTFWMSLLCLFWRGVTSAESKTGRTVNMAMAVTIIPFLPASNLFFRVGFVLAERVLYLPSLGYCMLVILGMQVIMRKSLYKRTVLIFYCLVLVLFTVRSMQRSNEWLEENSLFLSALAVCPLNAKVHYNVAKNAGDRGNQNLAIREYEIALKLHPEYDQAMNNLANILRDAGELSKAESLLRTALKIRPDFAAAWMNLGIVLAGKKQHKEAEVCYSTALSHRSKYPECLYNLGNLYLDLKMHSEALRAFKRAVQQRPKFSIAWNNMVILLESTGNLMEAKSVAHEALKVLPNDPGLHFNLANTLGKLNLFSDAEHHFKKAIQFAPKSAIYHSNMGVLYHRWKKYDLAEAKYRDALQYDSNLKSALNNIDMLRKSKEKIQS